MSLKKILICLMISLMIVGQSSCKAFTKEITKEEMKEIITDNKCLLVEIDELKKSLDIERNETDKYILLASELNQKHVDLENRYKLEVNAYKRKRIGGIVLGCIVGLSVGIAAGLSCK